MITRTRGTVEVQYFRWTVCDVMCKETLSVHCYLFKGTLEMSLPESVEWGSGVKREIQLQ